MGSRGAGGTLASLASPRKGGNVRPRDMDANIKGLCKNNAIGDEVLNLQKLYKFVEIKVKHTPEVRTERSGADTYFKKEFHINADEVVEDAKNETKLKHSKRKRKARKRKNISNGELKKAKMSLVEGK